MKDPGNKVAVITGGGSGLGRELAPCCAGIELLALQIHDTTA